MLPGSQCPGRRGTLQSVGSQRGGCDLAAEQRRPHGGIGAHGYVFILLVYFGCAGPLLPRGACSSCGEWGLLCAVSGASHRAGLSRCRAQVWAQGLQQLQPRGAGARSRPEAGLSRPGFALRGTRNLLGPGVEPVSSAPVGGRGHQRHSPHRAAGASLPVSGPRAPYL